MTLSINLSTMINSHSSHKKQHGAKLPQRFWGRRAEEIKYRFMSATGCEQSKDLSYLFCLHHKYGNS